MEWQHLFISHGMPIKHTEKATMPGKKVLGARICVTKVKLKVGVDVDEHIQNRARKHSFQQT